MTTKELVLILLLSVVINFIVNLILYTQVGNIIDWTIFVLCISSAVGIVKVFEKERKDERIYRKAN